MAALQHSPEAGVISTKAFYSSRQKPEQQQQQEQQRRTISTSKENGKQSPNRNPSKINRRSLPNHSSINMNRGVKHHIRRRSSTSLNIDSILSNIRNEKLRNRIETNRQAKKVHSILRNSKNPIELARPLRALNMSDDTNNNNKTDDFYKGSGDFSDCDSFSDDMEGEGSKKLVNRMDERSVTPQQENVNENENVPTSRPETPNENRKFFKSGQTAGIAKEVRITENIRAMVCNGKISLISHKRKMRGIPARSVDFSVAQAAVNDIIKNLDDSSEVSKITENSSETETVMNTESHEDAQNGDVALNEIELLEPDDDYSNFRKRIPYDTEDPVKTEEQHFLLDFLISHNLCNENTFNIFIADPENHRQEATKIVNEVLTFDDNINEEFRQRIPFNTDDPAVIEQQKYFVEFLISHNLLTEENFDIFITNYEKRRQEADAILANVLGNSNENLNVETIPEGSTEETTSVISNLNSSNDLQSKESDTGTSTTIQKLFPIFYPGQCRPLEKKFSRRSRTWNGGFGSNQYQIDAGQKEFGAKQCKQCGLVYGVHEAEEEKLHRDFHSSFHVLRFKGWIDEDQVADYPEWGRDGRIIRITDSANPKRRERLNEILKIVDKELGFSSYIIPQTFVAYLAIRNCLIVGFCLVQPLEKANKYICSNGVDCCTIEEFEAKCGISRIWVTPLHRRMHIAEKLLQAVRFNTIMGEEIPFGKIAFSAPTEDGKRFAQKVTGTESFLVYQ